MDRTLTERTRREVANRYDLGYIPFVSALRSPGWLSSRALGQGPDFFPLHLRQAQAQLPDGRTIPPWLICGWPLMWLVMPAATATRLNRAARHAT